MVTYLPYLAILFVVALIGCVAGFSLNEYARFQLWCLLRAIHSAAVTVAIGGLYSTVIALAVMQLIQQLG